MKSKGRKFNSEVFELRSLARKVYKEVERVNDPAATQDSIDALNDQVREPTNGEGKWIGTYCGVPIIENENYPRERYPR